MYYSTFDNPWLAQPWLVRQSLELEMHLVHTIVNYHRCLRRAKNRPEMDVGCNGRRPLLHSMDDVPDIKNISILPRHGATRVIDPVRSLQRGATEVLRFECTV
jgi:hypothetical protein